jgi:hypothetical protein
MQNKKNGAARTPKSEAEEPKPSHKSSQPAVKLLPFHPLADKYGGPLMEGKEFDDLVEDIRKHGLRQDIDLYEGKILDGRNRARALAEAGVPITLKTHVRRFYDDAGAIAFIFSQNVHRRMLTAEEKRDLIAMLLKADPAKSDLQIGKETKTSHATVARVRAKLEKSGDVEHRSTRTDTKGRQQPATKPPKSPTKAEQKALVKAERQAFLAEGFETSKAENYVNGNASAERSRIIDAGYRTLAKEKHPDVGGSHEEMLILNQARKDIEAGKPTFGKW